MELKPDCVRDVLLTIEAAPYGQEVPLATFLDELPQYNRDDIQYTIYQLNDGRYIDAQIKVILRQGPVVFCVKTMTCRGHEFLADLKSDSTWNKVKQIATTAGTLSLSSLATISKSVIANAITAALLSSQ